MRRRRPWPWRDGQCSNGGVTITVVTSVITRRPRSPFRCRGPYSTTPGVYRYEETRMLVILSKFRWVRSPLL